MFYSHIVTQIRSRISQLSVNSGIIASPGTVRLIRGAIAVVRKVRFFKGALHSGAKFHISVGHTTVMASVTFWGESIIIKKKSAIVHTNEVQFPVWLQANPQQISHAQFSHLAKHFARPMGCPASSFVSQSHVHFV